MRHKLLTVGVCLVLATTVLTGSAVAGGSTYDTGPSGESIATLGDSPAGPFDADLTTDGACTYEGGPSHEGPDSN